MVDYLRTKFGGEQCGPWTENHSRNMIRNMRMSDDMHELYFDSQIMTYGYVYVGF